MSTELLFTKRAGEGLAAKIELDHGALKPDDYMQLYAQFGYAAGFRKPPDFIEMHTLHPDQYRLGVWWAEHHCPDGCRFTLIVEPHVGHIVYTAIKLDLRNRFDVVSFKTLRITKFIEFHPNLTTPCQPS